MKNTNTISPAASRLAEDMEAKMSDIQSTFIDRMQFLKNDSIRNISQFRLGGGGN